MTEKRQLAGELRLSDAGKHVVLKVGAKAP